MHRILVLHGPNLDVLGTREPELYGQVTLDEVNRRLADLGRELGCRIECLQSNHEGVLIDALHRARGEADGVLLNPGGLTHDSVSLRDAAAAAAVPIVEVHLTNPYGREMFRQRSLIAGVAVGTVQGFGVDNYLLGLRALAGRLGRGRQV